MIPVYWIKQSDYTIYPGQWGQQKEVVTLNIGACSYRNFLKWAIEVYTGYYKGVNNRSYLSCAGLLFVSIKGLTT